MIALGCDHGGYELKQEIIKYLEENNLPFKDFGCYDNSSVADALPLHVPLSESLSLRRRYLFRPVPYRDFLLPDC